LISVAEHVPAPAPAVLYVAPDFTSWVCDRPECFASDLTVNGVAFRALDPDYYAFLRHRMTQAKEAHVAGKLPQRLFDQQRFAFNAIHEWAIAHLAERDLLRSVDRMRPKHYDPPKPFSRPGSKVESDCAPRRKVVSPLAVAQVDAIRDAAMQLGWTFPELYGTTGRFVFPYGGDYGLVCFLGDGTRVGEVTVDWIEILHGSRMQPLRFYRRK